MRKDVLLKLVLLVMLFIGMFTACDDDEKVKVGNPDVAFNTETGEYRVKVGKEVLLQATVSDAMNPLCSWKLNGKIVSTDTTYLFRGEQVGDYFVNFKIDAENGSIEKQVKVSVLDKLPPEVTLDDAAVVMSGRDRSFGAEVSNPEGATYMWVLNGEIVCQDSLFVFNREDVRMYDLSLVVRNEDGATAKSMTVTVVPLAPPKLIFNDGRYRTVSDNRITNFSVPLGRELVLSPYPIDITEKAVYEWQVDGVKQSETTSYFKFAPTAQGRYYITVTATEGGQTASTETYVECVDPEGTHRNWPTDGSSARFTEVFEYIPAPGQFVNFPVGSTEADALAKGKTILDPSTPYLSLGAYGGYVVIGFDHSVENVPGEYDLILEGNAFAGSSEPGIVWVMQDENGNGLPDDTWYELKGSASAEEMSRKYVITYYRPTQERGNSIWSDNYGNAGSVDVNGYHGQTFFFPMFIEEDFMHFGTRLASKVEIRGGLWYNGEYDWGYVDNYGTDKSCFKIDNAIQVDGTPANLKYIDFVMIQTSVNQKAGVLGESSTEFLDGYDYHLKNK